MSMALLKSIGLTDCF